MTELFSPARLVSQVLSVSEGGSSISNMGREACPIFLGPTILSRLKFLDLFFCLFKSTFLGSYLAENLLSFM